MSENNELRKVEFPNLGDYEVFNNLQGLRRVFAVHKRIMDKTGESYPYYPDEVKEFSLDFNIYDLWESNDYETIEEVYVHAWISNAEFIFEKYVYFTLEEFIDGTAGVILKK